MAPLLGWEEIRQRSLQPVMDALLTRDIAALRAMYRNFFRNPCSTGLIGVPYGMTSAYFGPTIKDVHRRYYLSEALHHVEYWSAQTSGRFALRELAAPEIGNPFGVVTEGTLVEAGAPYRHYCAHRICSLLDSEAGTVAELGGGFGGMAYYLLRDRPATRYLDFDVPESIALTSYYLMKAFPRLTFLLYGEEEITKGMLTRADVVLLPLFELARIPPANVAVTFSSHSMSDIPSDRLPDYLNNIARITRKYFLYTGVDCGKESISKLVSERHQLFRLEERRLSGWHSHKTSDAIEVECLYCLEAVDAIQERASPFRSSGCSTGWLYVRHQAMPTSNQAPGVR